MCFQTSVLSVRSSALYALRALFLSSSSSSLFHCLPLLYSSSYVSAPPFPLGLFSPSAHLSWQ